MGAGHQICLLSPPNQWTKFLNQINVCILTYKRYNSYQTGFSFGHLGHAPVVGLGGAGGMDHICWFVCQAPNPLVKIQPNSVSELLT